MKLEISLKISNIALLFSNNAGTVLWYIGEKDFYPDI
jgi:hypothetical protein